MPEGHDSFLAEIGKGEVRSSWKKLRSQGRE